MQFQPLYADDAAGIQRMAQFAQAIVKDYFDPLIGAAQNDYMISRYQTAESITEQLAHGYEYFFVCDDAGAPVGFLAYVRESDRLYLSKFYLHQSQRGKGYSRAMCDFVIRAAKAEGLKKIELNVFKHNDLAIAVYEALGFKQVRAEENDIGGGFVLDDYVYALMLE